MSNFLAVANVTAALDELLSKTVNSVVSGATVSTLRPDKLQEGATGVNLFLYQITPNAAWRNADLPTRDGDGQVMQRPLITLDLHYLLSFYGDTTKLEPERLLGGAMSALQTQPQLNRAVIQAAKNNTTRNDNGALLLSDLDQQVDLVKFTLLPLNLEELSKLWSVFFQVPYRLSVAYVATVVLIESAISPNAVLPVREPSIDANTDQRPALEKIFSQINVLELKNLMVGAQALIVGGDLFMQGQNLLGPETFVRFDQLELRTDDASLQWELSAIQIVLRKFPAESHARPMRAGSRCMQLVHKSLAPQQPSDPRQRIIAVSNSVAFLVRPLIKEDELFVNAARELEIPVSPKVGPEQSVVLYLNEKAAGNAPPRSYTIPEPQQQRRSRVSDVEVIKIPLAKVERGTYLVRLEVAGVTSPLRVDEATGEYVGPFTKLEVVSGNLLIATVRPLASATQPGNAVMVRAEVEVKDQNGARVAGAQVTAQWLTPQDPQPKPENRQIKPTGADGIARFEIADGRSNSLPYVFEVRDLVLADYAFDQTAGHLRETLRVPELGLRRAQVSYILLDLIKENGAVKEIRGYVLIEDVETKSFIPGAKVKATWTFSSGAPEAQEEVCNPNTLPLPLPASKALPGEAAFVTRTVASERVTLTITEVVGYELDSQIKSKSINLSHKAAKVIAMDLGSRDHLDPNVPNQRVDGLVYIRGLVKLRGDQNAVFEEQTVKAIADWFYPDNSRNSFEDDRIRDGRDSFVKFNLPTGYDHTIDPPPPVPAPFAERGTYVLAIRNIEFPATTDYYFSRFESLEWVRKLEVEKLKLYVHEVSFQTIDAERKAQVRVKERLTEVNVKDANGAVVKAEWTLPNGEKWPERPMVETTDQGYAHFSFPQEESGKYTLTVIDLAKRGCEYDPTLNVETSASEEN